MKTAAIAALAAKVAAKPTCNLDKISWKLYSDKNCKKFDKKAQAAYGKVKDSDKHLWSGDCEKLETP